ncbi:unnamed protein product [Allacma fusca]|uniref:XK-related protein n=1 Tax=Allacma fusca TaxID=39272 RepID=A0A8J2J2W2_9HEXA|nr:unnamed protein product [Allacma fusca]
MSLEDTERVSRILPASAVTTITRDVETGPASSGTEQGESSTSTLFQNRIQFHHLAAATGLIVTYFIEIIVQIFLIVHCCRPFILFTSAWWDWSSFLAISFLVSSLAVTIVSIVWVCRGLDFAGRLCGRLLCYVMHSLLLGLLWRYLKLAFVYDRADVQEFVALRIFQAYFQSLPLTSIHLAWLINSRENWSSVTLGIILVEFLSILTALVLSSYIKSDDQRIKSKGEVMQIIVKNLNCSSDRQNSLWPQLLETKLTILSRSLLLCSRLLVVGIIIVHLKYWTCMFILLHFMVSFTWISYSVNNHSSSSRTALLEEMEEVSLTKGKDFVTLVTECSYILFWDVTSMPSAINLWTWVLPVLLVLLENGTVVLFHWHKQEDRVVTIISGTCLLLGWLVFSSLNFINTYSSVSKCCSPHPTHKETKTGVTKDMSPQTQTLPVIDPMIKTCAHSNPSHTLERAFDEKSFKMIQSDSLKWNSKKIPATWDLNLFSTTPTALPNNYNINEKLVTKARADLSSIEVGRNRRKFKTESPEALVYRASPPEGPRSNSINPSQSPLLAPTTWVPDTCCNDSNGSSNSRNTNTIRDTGTHHPDLDNDTDVDNSNFVFYFPTDTSGQQSVTSARFQKCTDRSCRTTPLQSQAHDHYHHHHHHHGEVCRKPKKKSRSSSISSFRNIRQYRTSTPIEIKRASRIAVNPQSVGNNSMRESVGSQAVGTQLLGSQCCCHADKSGQGDYEGKEASSQYEKLIEDSYGILICEGESSPGMCAPVYKNEMNLQPATVHSLYHASKKLKVLCAKCLQNHDPLLTNCLETDVRTMSKHERSQVLLALGPSSTDYVKGRTVLKSSLPRTPPVPTVSNSIADDEPLPSDTTDYPSETEMTCTLEGDDQLSVSSNLSTATYTTWPHQSQPNLSMWTTSTMMPQSRFPKEFTSLEYVRTWLLTSQARLRQHRQETKSRHAKKVYRSNTMAAQSRKVRFVGAVTKDAYVRSVSRNHKCLGRRYGPVGCGPSLQLQETTSRSPSTSLSFQPPPRQKQHPVLPHSVIPHHKGIRAHTNCHNSSGIPIEHSDSFYKDVEIIL